MLPCSNALELTKLLSCDKISTIVLPGDLVSLGMIHRTKCGAVLRSVVISLFNCSYFKRTSSTRRNIWKKKIKNSDFTQRGRISVLTMKRLQYSFIESVCKLGGILTIKNIR